MHRQLKGKTRTARRSTQQGSGSDSGLNPSSGPKSFPLITFVKYVAVFVMGFYSGGISTYQYTLTYNNELKAELDSLGLQMKQVDVPAYERRIAECQHELEQKQRMTNKNGQPSPTAKHGEAEEPQSRERSSSGIFAHQPKNSLIGGIGTIDRNEFLSTFDYGTPNDGDKDVLIFYHSKHALPGLQSDASQFGSHIVPLQNAKEAVASCDFLNVFTVPKYSGRVCSAMVHNFENWHSQKWMRVAPEGTEMDIRQPLRVVNRGRNEKGRRFFKVPDAPRIAQHWENLQRYFQNFDSVIEELKPIAEKMAVKNTIIVMTCNMGQSELLMNFVCNAKAKGLDVSNVLVFPTDQETKDLAEGLGLSTFHDERNFGHLPKGEARHYADKTFTAMMFAKVSCVQMINHLGYDLLFQDVDVVWNKNPLDFFHDPDNKLYGFDMYFQDDGAHSRRYAPYSANSGFYYVRNNYETRYLFVSLLYAGDLILTSNSHQQPLIQLMAEHSSQFGLKVKVLDREMNEFPGGWHFNSRKTRGYMKKLAKGEVDNYIFHMSWTNNKQNKLKYFEQMGEWYLRTDVCYQKTKDAILKAHNAAGEHTDRADILVQPCCLTEPKIVCHYRDKPSKIPCKDSPPIDKGKRSFW